MERKGLAKRPSTLWKRNAIITHLLIIHNPIASYQTCDFGMRVSHVMIKMASNIMFMCCLFCGVDLSTAVKYNKQKLLNFQDHFSLWKELACKYNQESSTSIDTDHEIDGSLMCHNCFHTCCSYFDERSKVYNKLKNAWSTKLSLIGTPQVSLSKRSRSGQGVAGEPPRK